MRHHPLYILAAIVFAVLLQVVYSNRLRKRLRTDDRDKR